MTGVDQLLASSLEKIIKSNLGDITVNKMQNRLFEKYGMSITQSIEDFEKLDSVLREFFGSGAEGLEKRFLDSLCSLKSKKESKKKFVISEQSISQIILHAFSDEDTSKIMNATVDESFTIYEILEKCHIPQTSGYRKINSLIDEGLLIRDDFVISSDKKKVNKYRSLFENVKIDINKNKVTVNVQFTEDVIKQSSILQVVYGA